MVRFSCSQRGPNISCCTKTQTLPNLRLSISSGYHTVPIVHARPARARPVLPASSSSPAALTLVGDDPAELVPLHVKVLFDDQLASLQQLHSN